MLNENSDLMCPLNSVFIHSPWLNLTTKTEGVINKRLKRKQMETA